jgi:hypothetical protein
MTPQTRKKRKGHRYFIELIVVTVVSLVAAHLWATWIRQMVDVHFKSSPNALLIVAVIITISSVMVLQYLFAEAPDDNEETYLSEKQM